MGVVIRQSIKVTIINTIGSIIGALSVLFIYPLKIETYGLSQAILNFSLFLMPFISFGTIPIVLKFFNKRQKSSNIIIVIAAALTVLFGLIFLVLFLVFLRPNVSSLNVLHLKTQLIEEYGWNIVGITFLMVLNSILISQSYNYERASIPNLLNNVSLKIFLPIVIISNYFGFVSQAQIPSLILYFHFTIFVILFFYVKKLGGIPSDFKALSQKEVALSSVVKASTIYGLTNLAGALATKIDVISIVGLQSLTDVGKYSLPFFMASLIEIPLGGISSISSSFIVQHLVNHEYKELDLLLKKASNSLFLVGSFIFIILFSIFEDLVNLSSNPAIFQSGFYIFIIIGLSKLIDMVFSLNNYALSYSKYYTYNIYFVSIISILNLFLTYYFTKNYGIVGTSFSILITVTVYNCMKFAFLKYKLNLNPFTKSTLKLIFIFLLLLTLSYFVNLNFSPLINIFCRGVLFSFLFLVCLKLFKPVEEIDILLFGKQGILLNYKNIIKILKG